MELRFQILQLYQICDHINQIMKLRSMIRWWHQIEMNVFTPEKLWIILVQINSYIHNGIFLYIFTTAHSVLLAIISEMLCDSLTNINDSFQKKNISICWPFIYTRTNHDMTIQIMYRWYGNQNLNIKEILMDILLGSLHWISTVLLVY